jgi:hypothetical protein
MRIGTTVPSLGRIKGLLMTIATISHPTRIKTGRRKIRGLLIEP